MHIMQAALDKINEQRASGQLAPGLDAF